MTKKSSGAAATTTKKVAALCLSVVVSAAVAWSKGCWLPVRLPDWQCVVVSLERHFYASISSGVKQSTRCGGPFWRKSCKAEPKNGCSALVWLDKRRILVSNEPTNCLFLMLNFKQESCEYQLLKSLIWPDRESNPSLTFQLQTLYPLDHWSVNLWNHQRSRWQISSFQNFCSGSTCPSGWTLNGTFCYGILETLTYWANARSLCDNDGGDLVSIHSQAENDFVSTRKY